MHILGISCYFHDSAAALLRDGQLVAAAEEERFSRRKHDASFPHRAVAFCLRAAALDPRDLDFVVFYEKPLLKLDRIVRSALPQFPWSWRLFRDGVGAMLGGKLQIRREIAARVGVPASRVIFVEHHTSHAASAFLCSPFDEAAVLTVDGVGEWATATAGHGSGGSVSASGEIRFPHSLGLLYSAFTSYLGFDVNDGEYKVMGMAAYGVPRYMDEILRTIEIAADGSFRLDLSYFRFQYGGGRMYSQRLVDLLGPPRRPESPFFTPQTHPDRDGPDARANERYADIAASVQRATEELLLRAARNLARTTGASRLCLAGGVALNSAANGRLARESGFDELWVQPAAGDAGGALGAALYAHHAIAPGSPRFVMEHAYWGERLDDEGIAQALAAADVPHTTLDEDALLERVVDALAAGKVVGWCDGRFEWGPRALGARSILADPRRAEMQEVVNVKIKRREPFRPFAPVVLESAADRYFELADPARQHPARFMLLVTPVRDERRDEIPAVTHFDGSARPQTVHTAVNGRYARLVGLFGEATGVPVLLNTSFNLRGEPIVNTPEEAIASFSRMGLDVLVLGNAVVERH